MGKGAILEEPGGLSPLAKSSGKRWAVKPPELGECPTGDMVSAHILR